MSSVQPLFRCCTLPWCLVGKRRLQQRDKVVGNEAA